MRRSRVQGPNSALTEFLRVEGITDAFKQRQDDQGASPTYFTQTRKRSSSSKTSENVSRRGSGGDIPDGVDTDGSASETEKLRLSDDDSVEPDAFGQDEDCVDCGNPFTVTVYSRYVDTLKGYICEDCNELLKARERTARRNQANARKRRKKLAKALLDKKSVRIASLQDVCIREISSNISQIKALGDIGQANINKISKILSKNRSLDDSTVTLFLNPDLIELELWDCSNVSSESFSKIAAYCCRIESLTLFMCGQFHNDNLVYFKDKLTALRKLSLNGPFLISDQMWQDYFESPDCGLTEFEVRNTHRFKNDSLISLLDKRGSSLISLKLSRLDGLDSAAVYELIPEYISPNGLRSLEISYPESPSLVSDDLIIHILAITGESLRELNLDGCLGLTDAVLLEGVAKFCPNLESLSMKNLDKVTDIGMASAWRELSKINYGGLINVDLSKCINLGDEAISELLAHSSNTLVDLSLNSLNKLTKKFLVEIMSDNEHTTKKIKGEENEPAGNGSKHTLHVGKIELPLLTKLDVGFVRAFDDEVAEKVTFGCPKLAVLEVFGNNKCTANANTRPDVLIIGRQGEDL